MPCGKLIDHMLTNEKAIYFALHCLPFLVGCATNSSPRQVQSKIPGLHTPQPPYPVEGFANHSAGEGTCHVEFGHSGHVAKASMSKSTGSKLLDAHTVRWAREQWTGQANTTVNVPVAYLLIPKPPYPSDARFKHVSGSGVCIAVFDAAGNPTSVRMIKSTGSVTLDENTVQFGLKHWHAPSNGTVKVPITYRLRYRNT